MSDELIALLGCLCEGDNPVGWGLADPDLGEGVWLESLEDDRDLGDRTLRFYENLGDLFTVTTPVLSVERLVACFGSSIPRTTLTEILGVYQAIAASAQPRTERLLTGLRELLPQWSSEDLGLFVRPYSVAMRGETGGLELLERDWAELSELERANYVVAIANYVVTELDGLA